MSAHTPASAQRLIGLRAELVLLLASLASSCSILSDSKHETRRDAMLAHVWRSDFDTALAECKAASPGLSAPLLGLDAAMLHMMR
jgi:hypothetical protein